MAEKKLNHTHPHTHTLMYRESKKQGTLLYVLVRSVMTRLFFLGKKTRNKGSRFALARLIKNVLLLLLLSFFSSNTISGTVTPYHDPLPNKAQLQKQCSDYLPPTYNLIIMDGRRCWGPWVCRGGGGIAVLASRHEIVQQREFRPFRSSCFVFSRCCDRVGRHARSK